MSEDGLKFNMPKNLPSIIKVLGAGGGGSNAVNHMYEQGIKGVDFIVCNTDQQALDDSPVPHKIQLGTSLTEGNGAGAIPEVGMNSAIESIEEVRAALEHNTKMLFITAGMGGGTGTGAAPVIARVAKEMGILTVGIVTMPFVFEGKRRQKQAEEGIQAIRESVDTLLIINNDKLRLMYGNLRMTEAFGKADDVLTVAAKGIAEIITTSGLVNVDFKDVETVMKNSGVAIMGAASATGEDRAIKAVEQALSSPLLNDNDISGSRHVLLNMEYGTEEPSMDEIAEITDYIVDESGNSADVIWGYGKNEELGEELSVTIIATGFEANSIQQAGFAKDQKPRKIVLEEEKPAPAPQQKNQFQESVQEPFVKKAETPAEETSKAEVEQSPFVFDFSKPAEPAAPQAEEPKMEAAPKGVNEPKPVDEPFIVRKPENQAQTHVSHAQESESQEQEAEFQPEEGLRNRLSKIKDLSDKFRGRLNGEELENVPAYKRRQIRLNDVPHSSESKVSRYTLTEEEGPDGEKKMDIRPNNSFLHDNVD